MARVWCPFTNQRALVSADMYFVVPFIPLHKLPNAFFYWCCWLKPIKTPAPVTSIFILFHLSTDSAAAAFERDRGKTAGFNAIRFVQVAILASVGYDRQNIGVVQ